MAPPGPLTTVSTGVPVLLGALESLVGSGVALFVPAAGDGRSVATRTGVPGIPAASTARLAKRVRAWQAERTEATEAAGEEIITSLGWQMAVAESRTASGRAVGVVALARRVEGARGWAAPEISAVRTFADLCGSWAEVEGEGSAPSQPGAAAVESSVSQTHLDALVTRIAVDLMAVSADSLDESLERMLRVLSEFFAVDISYMRRNNIERNASILVAEWPHRENVPDPDPLGEVPFGVDPVFDAIRDLKEPFVVRPTESSDSYQERVEQGSGIEQVSMVMVPLLRGPATVGVLGFVKFGDRPWETAETNALQAVASLMVLLEGRVEAEERLQYLAYHDELTNLPNRRAVLEELQRRLDGEGGPTTALLFLDLDRFKVLNDFLGHGAGDHLLETLGERLRHAVAEGDFVARLAGDEFVLLLDRPAGALEALAVANSLLGLVAAPVEITGHLVNRTPSVGVAFGDEGMTPEDLLAHGDAALHVAKAQGGNQVVVFDAELRASVQLHSDTELQLRGAIDHGGLLLHYQPEVDLRTGQLLAVEALVRWDHPQRGLLAAGSFIKVAEETGLIVDLGWWVLGEACRQMAVWRREYPDIWFSMRINVSPAQLATRNIVQLVKDALEQNALPGHLICFEITEHAVMQDVERALQVLHELKALGVSLAIDDFGTGYSSMAQLKRLPVDTLKVDQTFVAGLGADDGDRAIVDATVRLAEAFGLDVVAEGVETAALVDELLALGCYRAQGYLLSRPKPAADLVPVLVRGGIDPAGFRSPPVGPAARVDPPSLAPRRGRRKSAPMAESTRR